MKHRALLIFFAILCLFVGWEVKARISKAYVDFGDGNYNYIVGRMMQGQTLYADILAPQPPLHFMIGTMSARLGRLFTLDPMGQVAAVRIAVQVMRLLTAAAIMWIAWEVFASYLRAALAGLIYLLLPNGYLWSLGYQSEHIELLCLTAACACLVHHKGFLFRAGLLAGLALASNMTALPYVVLMLVYTVVCLSANAIFFIVGTGVSAGFIYLYWLVASGGALWSNVWSNQVGTFPPDLLNYFLTKLLSEGTDIMTIEAVFLGLAMAGAWVLYCDHSLALIPENSTDTDNTAIQRPHREMFLLWYFFWGLGSIVFVAKGGTQEYIFMLAGPGIALLSANFLGALWEQTEFLKIVKAYYASLQQQVWRWWSLSALVIAGSLVVGLLIVLMWMPMVLLSQTRQQLRPDVRVFHHERIVAGIEYPCGDVQREVLALISRFMSPGQELWAPPWYAFLSQYPIPGELCETFIWFMRWRNMVVGGLPDPGVIDQLDGLRFGLEQGTIGMLLINTRLGQFGCLLDPDISLEMLVGSDEQVLERARGSLQPIHRQLRNNYYHLKAPGESGQMEPVVLRSKNETLLVFVPNL